MKTNYDFSKSVRNPYIGKLKKQISIRLDVDTIEYFKNLSSEIGIPYQKLMNQYLRKCAEQQMRPSLVWIKAKKKQTV